MYFGKLMGLMALFRRTYLLDPSSKRVQLLSFRPPKEWCVSEWRVLTAGNPTSAEPESGTGSQSDTSGVNGAWVRAVHLGVGVLLGDEDGRGGV